jgi:predicted enzyme related to lactoylglutathione lyase
MSRVIHFEINAKDPQRLAAFYESVFGWQVHSPSGTQPYWPITTGDIDQPGIDGGIVLRQGSVDQPVTPIVRVESLVEAVACLQAQGGLITVPTQPVHGVGFVAYGTDPEGREFGLMQLDATAGS